MISFIEKIIPYKLKPLYLKYKSIIWYLIFGGLTTIINIILYYVCYNILQINNKPSNIIAWIITITFAYLTNRSIVFNSNVSKFNEYIKEFLTFFICRFLTGLLDLGIMIWAVEYMEFNSFLWKIISNVIVIITNYLLSKFIVFKNKCR